MKSIKVIKQKRDDNSNETRAESKKPAEPSTRNLVNTVKTWIAEAEQRKRSQRRSLSALGL